MSQEITTKKLSAFTEQELYELLPFLKPEGKYFAALIGQSASNAPIVQVLLINQLGSVTFQRSNAGVYSLTFPGYNKDKTFAFVSPFALRRLDPGAAYNEVTNPLIVSHFFAIADLNNVQINSFRLPDANLSPVYTDSLLNNQLIVVGLFEDATVPGSGTPPQMYG